jgi:3-oxoacyl-[acyl-carrier protein] reductase
MTRLAGKTALVTGAAKGLGAAISRQFAAEGATVIVNDLRLEDAQRVASNIGGHAVAADVSDSGAVAAMFAQVHKLVPRLDILVNNAGIAPVDEEQLAARVELRRQQAEELAATGKTSIFIDATVEVTDEEWRRMQAVHVDGTFYCCREALKIMNPQLSGSIINMSSIIGTFGRGGNVPYAAAKAAILGLTRNLAHEVALRGIRVNAIAPGWIETDMTAPLKPMLPGIVAATPMRRMGAPEDIAHAAVYLASEEAKFITGQVLSPNGGWYMSQ